MPSIKHNKSDTCLWNEFRAGERDALGLLMERHYKDLFNYGSKFSNDKEKTKDFIQDLFSGFNQQRKSPC